jgi:hypothetical protein
MSSTQLEVVRLIAPEFASVSDDDVQKFLDIAPMYIDPERVPVERRGMVLALKACSLMVAQSSSASGTSHGGEITREKEGDLERSYGSSSATNGGNTRKNIYEQQLDALYGGILGGNITMRYGLNG